MKGVRCVLSQRVECNREGQECTFLMEEAPLSS